MQRLGKAWYQRRALRLFRDDTGLTATPHLWPSIEEALGKAHFLILLASREAALSPWVGKELGWWLDHRSADTVLIALTSGELAWDSLAGDFRWSDELPLPRILRGRFVDEPRWIDLRPYREPARARDARFTDLAADFSAALHGRPKEDLLSQEVRQQRRALRLAGATVIALLALLVVAGWQWTVARAQRARAEHNLALATETANGLVFNVARKFRNSGAPIAIISDVLTQADKLQDRLTAGGETSLDLRESQAVALDETAVTLLTIGNTKDALAAATKSHNILQGLVSAAPENTGYQSSLSLSDGRIGDVLRAQGNLIGALASYRDRQAISKTLAQKDPGNNRLQREVAVSDSLIADVLRQQGDLAGALAGYRDGMEISKTLTQKAPGNTAWQDDLATGDNIVGDALKEQGDLDAAVASYREGQAIVRTMVQRDPANTQWQRDLSISDERVGDALRAQGDLAGALASYRDGVAINKTLAQKDPGNTQWQRDLSISTSSRRRAYALSRWPSDYEDTGAEGPR
jgi:tetratricopeptide (TPR) repeat protein